MTIVRFQSYPGGVDDSDVKSWPVSGHVTGHSSGGPNNQPWGRFQADQTVIQASDPSHIRVHDWGIAGGGQISFIQPGQTSWRHIAIRIPSGFSQTAILAGDEVHQSSSFGTTGPAPVNLAHDGVGNRWYYVSRGDNDHGTDSVFHQTVFGRSSTSNGTLVNFTGGPRLVVADRWTYWLIGTKWDYTGAGWVEIWFRDDSLTDWVNVVPRYTGIYTCYNNSNFPMSSLYLDVSNGTRAIDFSNGFYSDSFTEALNQANSDNGFSGSLTPVNSALPTITGTAQVGNTLTGVAGTWTNTPTLTYQWEWDQGTGVWSAVNGATSLSFLCSATFAGAQVRLRETANGTIDAVSDTVTVNAVGGGTVLRRLSVVRGSGTRVSNPAGRLSGQGGGGL